MDIVMWLFEKCPPICNAPKIHRFTGPYPPTGEQVILQIHGYHKYLQESSKYQTSTKDAFKYVVTYLQDWWVKTGIATKSWQAIEKMIIQDLDEYKLRKKYRGKITDAEINKRNYFSKKMKEAYWIFQPDVEKKLAEGAAKTKQDQCDKKDWLYLESIRGEICTGTSGSRDEKLAKRKKRTLLEKQNYEERGVNWGCSWRHRNLRCRTGSNWCWSSHFRWPHL